MIEFVIKTNQKGDVTAELRNHGDLVEEFSADGLKMLGLLIDDTVERIGKVQSAVR